MNDDNRLRLSEAKNLFRQALQRQNDRAAGMKMPDDMEQRVMGSLQTLSNSPLKGEKDPPQPSLKGRESSPFKGELERVLGYVAMAASVLLLIMLNIGKQKPEQPPVIAEEVTVPQNNITKETTGGIEKRPMGQQPTQHGAKADAARGKSRRSTGRSEEPQPMLNEEAEQVPEPEQDYLPQQPDLYLLAVAEAQDIRARGERLYEEVAQMMNNH